MALEIFHTVRISNTRACLDNVPDITHKYGRHINAISFVGVAQPENNAEGKSAQDFLVEKARKEKDQERQNRDHLNEPVHPLPRQLVDIVNGVQTPSLHTRSIHFNLDWDDRG